MRQWDGFVFFFQVRKFQDRDSGQGPGGIGSFLQPLQLDSVIRHFTQLIRTHACTCLCQPIFFSCFIPFTQGRVRLKYQGGAVGVIQEETINHLLENGAVRLQTGFYLPERRFKSKHGQGIAVIKPGG